MERPNEFRLVAQRPAKEETAEAGADAVKGAEVFGDNISASASSDSLDLYFGQFFIRFGDGVYLKNYSDNDGATTTCQRAEAKIFRSAETAKQVARLFHGVVVDWSGRRK